MKFANKIFAWSLCLSAVSPDHYAQGFYKDIFMDGGVNLTHRTTLPASETLNLSMEYLATDEGTIQSNIMIGNANDLNGVLLYPDGGPRFRLLYTNGGKSGAHGNSLGNEGRERVRQFFATGGSYVGTCAGAFIASISPNATGVYEPYYHLWPGRTKLTDLYTAWTGHFIPLSSPLLKYNDFGGDHYISGIYHWGGCFARQDADFPPETDILLLFDYPSLEMHNKPSCWAYKKDSQSGRLVVIGSHPEGETSGEKLNLMEAMILYAIDGLGDSKTKGVLENGIERTMDKSTGETDPAHAKIGDKQIHHFTVEIPGGVQKLQITLYGEPGYHLNLYTRPGGYAYLHNAEYLDTTASSTKSLSVANPSDGLWYVGVECASAIQTIKRQWGYEYSGDLRVLNGISYKLRACWDAPMEIGKQPSIKQDYALLQNFPNPFNPSTTIQYTLDKGSIVIVSVYNQLGQKIRTLYNGYQGAGEYALIWDAMDEKRDPVSSGIYFYRLETGHGSFQKKMLLVR